MFVATMESESLSWMALGETEEDAENAILEKWNLHQRNLVNNGWKNSPDYYMSAKRLEEEYGITVTELEVNECKYW